MKAITVRQPWAWAIVSGLKIVENRTWRTPHRGPLLIHAGKSEVDVGHAAVPEAPKLLTFGAIIGTAMLVDCVPVADAPRTRFAEGPYCWLLEDVEQFRVPIPYAGKPGLFDVPDSILCSLDDA